MNINWIIQNLCTEKMNESMKQVIFGIFRTERFSRVDASIQKRKQHIKNKSDGRFLCLCEAWEIKTKRTQR